MTAPLHPTGHVHTFGDWHIINGLFFLRRRYCVISDCSEIEYGVFDNTGGFLRVVSLRSVEKYMDEVQEAYETERKERVQIETEAHSRLDEAHARLRRALLSAKLRLTGGF